VSDTAQVELKSERVYAPAADASAPPTAPLPPIMDITRPPTTTTPFAPMLTEETGAGAAA